MPNQPTQNFVWYVFATNDDGENLDLLAAAPYPRDAFTLWNEYYEDAARFATITAVQRITATDDTTQAYPWLPVEV